MPNTIPEDLLEIIKDLIAYEGLSKEQNQEYFIELPLDYEYVEGESEDKNEEDWKIEIQM